LRLITADSIRTASGVPGDALLIDGDRIVAVGRADTLRSPHTPEDHIAGGTIVPGLRDAHLHPVGHAVALTTPSLKAATDFSDLADALREADRTLPAGAALTAVRLDDESLAEGRLPDSDFLDAIVPRRPMLLIRYCGHVAVANSAALDLAGLDGSTTDPPGGSMDRSHGRLTGVLRETAIERVSGALLPLTPTVSADALVRASFGLASVGITAIGAMAATGAGLWSGGESEVDALVAASHRLAVEMRVMVIAQSPGSLEDAADRLDGAGGQVRFCGVKMFADGSLGGHTAAMHHGFSDRPDQTGTNRLDPEWAEEMARASLRLGGRVAIHAIGDRANSDVLDLMERLIREGADPSRLRVEHASVLTGEDISRFGSLGVTASVQPAFIASETGWLEKRVGPERLGRTYPFRSLVDVGAPIAGGSDCPVEPPHPLLGMATARDRCGLVPAEGLRPEEALALFTDWAATSIGDDASLEPGARASFTVLDTDPVVASPEELRSARVLATWVGGEHVATPPGTVAWAD
jgi:predicted amidohydrolase YtcJ